MQDKKQFEPKLFHSIHLRVLVAKDKQKTALIEKLTNAVASLAEKVEVLKGK